MASREEWCTEKLSKLLQEDLRISTLNEIKDHLESIPHDEASRTVHLLDLPLVFDCLNDSNTEQVDLACEVLSLCMTNLELGESTSRYDVPLERALNHPYPGVRTMALNEISRNISKEESIVDICKRTSLLNNVINCIGDDDIAVAKKASDIILALGISSMGLKALMSQDVIKVIQEVMSTNEIARLRVYEIVVNISKESELNFNSLKSTGLINQIFDELNNNDVLLRMNIIELITQLGLSRHGFDYLEENGILNKLLSVVEDNDTMTLQLCEPGILKFFGHMAAWKPIEMMQRYPKIFDRLFANVERADLTIVSVTLDTIGIIGASNQGKCALNSSGNKISYTIKTIARLLSSLPNEVRLRALNCLENLLKITDKNNDVMKMTRKWYYLLGDEPMEVILKYAKNPFKDIRLAGLGCLHAIAEQQWGQEEIKNSPGLIEFLLNRNVEVIKECKEMKYEIIKALSTSTTFDSVTMNRLLNYIKEGPFYVQGIMEVAFEGDD